MTSTGRTTAASGTGAYAPPGQGGFWRRRHVAVHLLAVVLTPVWVAVVFVAGLFLTMASPAFGWAYASLCFLPGLVGLARLGGVRRWRDTVLLAGVVSLVLGWVMYLQAPPDHGRIEDRAADAGLPVPGWELVDSDQRGNTWCFKGCPEVVYLYTTTEPPEQAVATLGRLLEDDGWTGGETDWHVGSDGPSEYDPLASASWRKGRWGIDLYVPPPASRYGWSEDAQARGLTPVEVSVDAGS